MASIEADAEAATGNLFHDLRQVLEAAAEVGSLGGGIFQQDGDSRRSFGEQAAKGGGNPCQADRFPRPQVGTRMHDQLRDTEGGAALHFVGEGGNRLLPDALVGRRQIDQVTVMGDDRPDRTGLPGQTKGLQHPHRPRACPASDWRFW